MKKLETLFALCLLMGVFSVAQDTTSSGKSKAENRTIRGCLAQGDTSGSFVLKANDGSTWDLKSDSVSLADHVGHTVTIKGTVSNITMHNAKEQAKDAAASAGMTKENHEHGDLKVDSVKMISNSCQ